MQKQQSALTVTLKRVFSGLISIILIVLSAVNLQFQMVCSHFLEASSQNCGSSCHWLQSGHHGVNFFHLVSLSVAARQLKGHGSEYYL